MKIPRILGVAWFAMTLTALAQIGDKPGEAQVPIVPAEQIPASPALTPEQELASFQIAPGFRIELVASEPLVGDPVAMTFDPDGRLWVVEMRSYMPTLDGVGEDKPTGRVVVLTDTDGDGRMDKSDVFLDGLIMPRAIALAHGGVLIGAPPKLWFCRDTDGDGKCDEKIEVANDYGVQVDPARPELANPERAPNALLWALDNWIYSGAYTAKFRRVDGKWERGVTTFRGQWGLSQDDFGHLFHNSNSDQLRGDIIPSSYLARNPHHVRPGGTNVKVAASQLVWPARVNPGINRGYRPEMLRDFRLKEFTAACAPWIYRGDLFGTDFYGNAFICEPAGNLIKRNILTATNGSLAAEEAYTQREFLASTDERFRPVNLTTGPDGALYVCDFYRGVIQHRISLTTYLRQQSEARGLDKPIGLGRIWRIVPANAKPIGTPQLSKESPQQWIERLSHPNAWWRETAQRLLVERGDKSLVSALEKVATSGAEPLGRLHAVCTLDGLGAITPALAAKLIDDADPRVCVAALRVSEPLLAAAPQPELAAKWIALTSIEVVPEVQLQLALTLGNVKSPEADAAMAALYERAADNVFLLDAVLTGLAGRELELFEKLASQPEGAIRKSTPLLAGLARCVLAERKPERITRLFTTLESLAQAYSARVTAVLASLAANTAVTAKNPVKLPAEPAPLAKLRDSKTAAAAPAAKVFALLTWPGKPGAKPEVAPTPLTPEQQAAFDAGKQLYTAVCAACHQPHGLGLEGLAPPLVDSEWVLGPVERLGRIVLNGLRGPIKVNGLGYMLDMPSMGAFDDAQLASVLTYIRREWGHGESPVDAATLKKLRAEVAKRQDAWTSEELLKLP